MKKYVLVDIDGTITKVGARLECLNSSPKDWDSFYDRCAEDEPKVDIISLVQMLSARYEILLCTGRRESCREDTVAWLWKNNFPKAKYLMMRGNGDFRHDTILKPELLSRAGIFPTEIAYALEDRNSMVEKWRELGITCLQVASGDF